MNVQCREFTTEGKFNGYIASGPMISWPRGKQMWAIIIDKCEGIDLLVHLNRQRDSLTPMDYEIINKIYFKVTIS